MPYINHIMVLNELDQIVERTDLKLFVALLMVFVLFVNWGGDNSWSRYDLTASIVEDSSLNIANHSDNTIDKALPLETLHDGLTRADARQMNFSEMQEASKNEITEFFSENETRTAYTDKAPMTSILGIPGYIIGDLVGSAIEPDTEDKWLSHGVADKVIDLSVETVLKQFLITVTVSAVPGALLILLAKKDLENYVDESTAFYTAIIGGLATPLLVYSSSLFGVVTAGFFGFSSYLLLQRSLETDNKKIVFISGLLSALAIATEYYAGLIPLTLAIYLASYRDIRKIAIFSSGVILGCVPLFIYHWAITGNPFVPVIMSADLIMPGMINIGCTVYEACFRGTSYPYIAGSILNPFRALIAALRLLFYPMRGLFFYAPVLLIAIPGTYKLYRRDKRLTLIFPGTFILFLLFQSLRLNWMAGLSFGPRYTIPALPFLLLPLALGLKDLIDRGRLWRYLVAILFLISAFNNLNGFGTWEMDVDRESYDEKFNSLSPLQDGYYQDRVENLLKYGPKSEVLMSLTGRYKGLDLTYRSPYGPRYFELAELGTEDLLISTSSIPLIIFSAVLTGLLWGRSERLRLSGLALTAIIILISLNASSQYISGEAYYSNRLPEAVNSSMTIVSNNEEISLTRLQLERSSISEYTNVTVSVNGEQRDKRKIEVVETFYIVTDKGRNSIEIRAEDCKVPAYYLNDSEDTRCLSFSLRNISTLTREEVKKPALSGFDGSVEDNPWMHRESSIIFSSQSSSFMPVVNLSRIPFIEDGHEPEFRLNGEKVEVVKTEKGQYKLLGETKSKGFNRIDIKSSRCEIPAENTNSSDERCLSYRLTDFALSNESYGKKTKIRRNTEIINLFGRSLVLETRGYIPKNIGIQKSFLVGEFYRYDDGIAPVNGTANLRYHGEEVPYLKISKSEEVKEKLDLNISTASRNRSLKLSGTETLYLTGLGEKKNSIRIETDFCRRKTLLRQCTPYRIEKLGYNETEDFEQPAMVYESSSGETYRKDFVLKSDFSIARLKIEENESDGIEYSIRLNGQEVEVMDREGSSSRVFYLTDLVTEDLNHIEIMKKCVSGSCEPFEVESIKTKSGNSLKTSTFLDGWYADEGIGRWMKERGDIMVKTGSDSSAISLDISSYDELEGSDLEIEVNGEMVRSVSMDRRKQIMIPLESEKEFNHLRLTSTEGCLIPEEVSDVDDDRCISFYLRNISVAEIEDERRYQRGWYSKEGLGDDSFRWMANRSYLLYNSSGQDILSLSASRYPGLDENASLSVFTEGEKVTEFKPGDSNEQIPITSDPGTTTLRIESNDGCEVPAKVEKDSGDERCLSFRFDELTIQNKAFGEGWYDREGDEQFSYRWMARESSARFVSEGSTATLNLELKPYRYLDEKLLEVIVNGKDAGTLSLTGRGRVRESIQVETTRGINNLTLRSRGGCTSPARNERNSVDERCLSFQFNRFEVS